MRLIDRLFPRRHTQIVRRDIMKLRASEWRSTPAMLSAAREMLLNPAMQQMLDVVRNEHPGMGMLPDDTPDYVRQHWQSKAEGYSLAIAVLESLAIATPQMEQLEATFEPEELPKTLTDNE